jgi:hypothetical protein
MPRSSLVGCHLSHLKTKDSWDDPHPIFLLECDNTAGESWLAKVCMSSTTGRNLARLQAALLLDQGIGYCFGCVDMKSNVIADSISRVPSESSLNLSQIPSAPCTGPQLAWLLVLPPKCRPHLIDCGLPVRILSLQASNY